MLVLRRTLPIAARFAAALSPALYMELRWAFPATKSGQDTAALLTGLFVISCVALSVYASRDLLARLARRNAR